MINNDLQKKIDFALKLLRAIPNEEPIELSYSGGKDSDVILELAKMAGINFRAIYKNTSIDPLGTESHCKSKGVEIITPKTLFFDIVKNKGCPTRRARFCCSELKEYKVLDRAIQGMRRSESHNRRKLYKEPEICRIYDKVNKVKVYLPILYWKDKDVEEFILQRGIRCHPLYYDKEGNFHVERRLGCLGCPMKSDNGVADYLRYPKLLKQLVLSVKHYLATHPNCRSQKNFSGDAYHLIFHNLFCKSYKQYKERVDVRMFPELSINPKLFLEEYFKIDL